MAEVTVNKISTDIVENYSKEDLNLIPSFEVISQFNPETDIVEFSIYNEQNLLQYIDYNYTSYTVTLDYNTTENSISSVNVNPEEDLVREGYDQGNYTVIYNFLRNQISSSQSSPYYIKEISSDRTEIRVANNNISNEDLKELINNFKLELTESPYFEDFEINFGSNNIFLANNILIDDTTEQYTVLIKLYEPLETSFSVKNTLTITLQTAEEVSYAVSFPSRIITPPPPQKLKGPNFNLDTKDLINNSTTFVTQEDLYQSTSTNPWSGSLYELQGILKDKGITPNIDYSDFNNFIYFSSAEQRVRNFYYKVSEIQDYSASIAELENLSNGDSSGSIASYQSKIGSIVQNFDEYEKYQYYSSGSLDIYPKLNDTPPYILALTSSTEAQSWLTDQAINSGSEYDNENVDRLYNSLPSYVQDDTRNTQFFLFIDMVGQHFDNIWVYTKDLSNRFDADNRLTYGISKDIVADAIRSMGVNLYQNNFSSENILTSLTGMNSEGGLLIPTGSEVIKEYITAPYNYKGLALQNTEYFINDVFYYYYGVQKFWVKIISPTYTTPNETVGSAGWQINLLNTEGINTEISEAENAFLSPTKLDDVNKEFYKRIFHNLPLLLKQKGSISGLRNLINTFGIPDTILRISEFGGKDKNERLDYDYYQDVFNYAAYLSGSSTTSRISIPFVVNSNWGSDSSRPEGMSFRFKPDTSTLPSTDTYSLLGAGNNEDSQITLTYTGSGYISESYSGSIPSESKYMAHITLWDDDAEVTSLSAPIYNGNWWTVGIGINGDSAPYIVALTVAESIYEGDDGFKIGHIATSQGNSSNMAGWKGTSTYVYPYTSTNGVSLDGNDYYGLTGSYQEIKFYNYPIDKTKIYDTTVNPHAILGENPSSSADNIIFRAPLGSELNTTTGTLTSVHPKITGSNILNSFSSDSNYTVGEDIIFLPNTEYYYYVQVPSGIKNRVKEKIRSGSLSLPSGDTLSPIRSIQQNYLTKESGSYTKDINLLEIAFSPQNEINDDINSSMGYFNIGEYIGDPRQISESVTSYPLLDNLRDTYFQKYYKNYNWNDYIRLIKFFDNSLFKMIKDFTPAKSSLATGVVIKQHLLERNKQRPALVTSSLYDYSGSIESGFTSGGTGGVFDSINTLTSSVSPQITQSWDYTIQTLSGSLSVNQSTQDEFYNGELSGSELTATNGELFINTVDPLTTSSFTQDRENSSGNQLFNFPLPDWANDPISGRAIIIVDTNINKITTIGLGGVATNAGGGVIFDFRGYYDLLGIGDVLTFAIPGPSPYTTPALNFTITNKRKYVNGLYNNYIFSVEHDWAPVGGWASLIENVAQYPPYGNLGGYLPWNGLIQIYDGSPINLREIYPDPSLNNVSNTRKSLIYQDVDYSTNAVTPVNYDLLKSNSALKAPIQDSNYTKKSWINSRYRGTRVSSLDFNTTIER